MDWDPSEISQERLQQLRAAAEAAWGDDTRHDKFRGNESLSAGQCYVTSRWLTSILGGYVGVKNGHYFWVSPDKTHIIDLTGDQFAYPPADIRRYGIKLDEEDEGWIPNKEQTGWRPGPIMFKRADHPLYKGFRIKTPKTENSRVALFSKRADAVLRGERLATDYFGDPHPMDEPQAQTDLKYLHDEPDFYPETHDYRFVYCNPTEAPIWMADLTFRPIGDIKIGDEIIGWSLNGLSGMASRKILCKSKVIDIYQRQAEIVKLTFESGRIVRCTADHRWLGYRKDLRWGSEFIKPRVGSTLVHVIDPITSEEIDGDARWLGGIFDGEGSASGGCVSISQCKSYNPEVHSRILEVIKNLGLTASSNENNIWLTGGRQSIVKFANFTRPVRIKKIVDQVLGGRWQNPDKIVSIENDGVDTVFGLTTTTGNYIVWGYASKNCNGKLEVSPDHEYDELLTHTGVSGDYNGPVAAGTVHVDRGKATWEINGNLGLRGFSRILRDYTKSVGWKWAGLLDGQGNPVGDDEFLSKEVRYLQDNDTGRRTKFYIQGKTAYVMAGMDEGALEAIASQGFKLAEVPGGTDMNDRLRNYSPAGEDYEMFNMGDPSPTDLGSAERQGQFKCRDCGKIFPNFDAYAHHLQTQDHMPDELPQEDGRFPEIYDDQPAPHYHEWPQPTINPIARRVASWREAARVEGYDLHSQLWGYNNDETKHYVAYINGEPLGYAAVRDNGEVVMVESLRPGIGTCLAQKLQQDYDKLWTHTGSPQGERLARKMGMINVKGQLWKWSAGSAPKDAIEAAVPFIYDVQKDDIVVGHPGQRHTDVRIPGEFTPGGIVEGTYEPGGKVVIRSMTNMPYSVRHVLDLWKWTHPHMEVTSLEMEDMDGNTTKLAAENVGSYLRTLTAADDAAWRAYQALRKEGGKVYVVGGAVRDALLQKEPKDIDLMVTGLPADVVDQTLSKLPGRMDITGRDFGVFRYNHNGHEVEIALPRTERSTGPRRVDFDVQVDHTLPVETDLLRRDFTANAMAVDLDTGELVDPYNGAEDIKKHRLDTVHESSFEEDPTRLVRALVASSRHGLIPTEKTRREITANAARLDGEAKERIQAELDKLFGSNNPAGAIRLAHETGLLKHIFPEVANNFDFDQNNPHHNYTLGEHLLNVLDNTQSKSTDPDLRLTALLHDIGKPASRWDDPITGHSHYYQGPNGEGANHDTLGADMAESLMRGLKYPNARIQRVKHLITHHMFPAFSSAKGARKFIHRVGNDHADDLLTLRWADQYGKGTDTYQDTKTPVDTMRDYVEQVRTLGEPTGQSALTVNGNDLLAMGLKPGPDVGRILRSLTNDVVEDPTLNDRNRLLERAKEYVDGVQL